MARHRIIRLVAMDIDQEVVEGNLTEFVDEHDSIGKRAGLDQRIQQRGLGDFQAQPARREPRLRERMPRE